MIIHSQQAVARNARSDLSSLCCPAAAQQGMTEKILSCPPSRQLIGNTMMIINILPAKAAGILAVCAMMNIAHPLAYLRNSNE
jgi:hypothetical protein